MSVILGKGLIFEFSKIAMLFRGVTVGPPRVHLGEVRGARGYQIHIFAREKILDPP
jgi:hypothetical protein